MAILDTAQNRIVIRIVYDGLPNAGKTTNLTQLATFFTPLRRGELYTPEEVEGRTLYFDWLQVEGGVVGGHRLRCEMVTVPGQETLRQRRARLLRGADGVVFVCDGTSMAEARRRLAELRTISGLVPIVLQANKQDDPAALAPAAIADALGDPALPVVAARASQGIGVRETAVMVIRAVAEQLQKYLIEHGPNAIAGTSEDPHAIYNDMVAAEAHATIDLPPLPDESAATGLVWPALNGRDVLRLAAAETAQLRCDLAGQNGGSEGSGKSDVFVFQAGAWCFKTSSRRRFRDLEEARASLIHLARTKLALEPLLLAGTTITIKRDAADWHWLWTVSPWVVTLRGELAAAARDRDPVALSAALRAYADCVIASARLASTRRIALDVHPSNFARWQGRLVYIDDDVDQTDRLPALGHAIVRRIDEYHSFECAVDEYVTHLRQHLAAELAPGSPVRAAVCDSLAGAATRTPEAAAGRALLIESLR